MTTQHSIRTASSSGEHALARWEQKRWMRFVTLLSSFPMRIDGSTGVKGTSLAQMRRHKDMVDGGIQQFRVSLVQVLGHRSHHGEKRRRLLLPAQVPDVLQHGRVRLRLCLFGVWHFQQKRMCLSGGMGCVVLPIHQAWCTS